MATTCSSVTFQSIEKQLAHSDYLQRKSDANPYFGRLKPLRAACADLMGDRQVINKQDSTTVDFCIQAYDPIQGIKRSNFLKRRPKLLASNGEQNLSVELAELTNKALKPSPKFISKFQRPQFKAHPSSLPELPISNRSWLAKQLHSVQQLPNVTAANESDEKAAKLARFSTKLAQITTEEEYIQRIRENKDFEGPYTGPLPYEPRPKTPVPNPYPRFVIDRTPVDEIKFRSERLDYCKLLIFFYFPSLFFSCFNFTFISSPLSTGTKCNARIPQRRSNLGQNSHST